MNKKSKRLPLLGLASLSLLLAGCNPYEAQSSSSSSSLAPSSSSEASSASSSSEESVSSLTPSSEEASSEEPTSSEESSSEDIVSSSEEQESSIAYSKIELLSPSEGASFDLTPDAVAAYLSAESESEQIEAIAAAKETANKNPTNNPVTLSWKKDGSANYTIYLSTNEDLSDATEIKVSSLSSSYSAKNLIPNATYYWKVKGTRSHDASKVSSFKTTGSSVRLINASGAYNIRDLGGWKAGDKQIAYGKLYRGGLLNNYNAYADLDDEGKKTFNNELGIKTEIDLRITGKDDAGQKECYFDANKAYIQGQLGQYNRIIDSESFAKSNGYDTFAAYIDANESASNNAEGISVKTLRTIFETLSDESNYPIYFHCNAGADRTGTLAFLIEGLLGVSYEDTIRDFELTSFSKFGERLRSEISADGKSFNESGVYKNDGSNYVAFGKLHDDMLTYYGSEGGDLSTAIYNFLTGYVGVPASSLNKIRDILLGDGEESLSLQTRQELLLDTEETSISLDLASAALDEGSISSITLANLSLGTDASNIPLTDIKAQGLAGEREFVIKGKKSGKDITVYAPALLISKLIKTTDDLTSIDTFRVDRSINYGYYRLENDIGADKAVAHGGYAKGQTSVNGSAGFRGTLDGNGKTIYVNETYGGLFSSVGGGAIIKNANFKVTKDGTSESGKSNDSQAVLAISIAGARLENLTFTVLNDGWGDNYMSGYLASGVGFISAYTAKSCLIKDVTIASDHPLVSLFGGLYYNGMDGLKFDNLVINCQKLGYLGIKSTVSHKSAADIVIDDCYLPMEFDGISGSYSTSAKEESSIKLVNGFASVGIGGKYGGMNLISATYKGKRIDDAAIESNSLMFSALAFLGEEASVNGTLALKLQKGNILCTYSLSLTLTN